MKGLHSGVKGGCAVDHWRRGEASSLKALQQTGSSRTCFQAIRQPVMWSICSSTLHILSTGRNAATRSLSSCIGLVTASFGPGASSDLPRPLTCRKGKSNTKDAEDKKKLLLTVAAGVAAVTAIVLGVKKAREVSSGVKKGKHVVHPGSKVSPLRGSM